ncbi:7700_t:CDS:2 [Rhizophagus irregularis]|nr:7700_t:CDS:2 [Rhizophagus irregularis]
MNDTSNSNVNNSFTISHISDDLNLQQQQQYYQQHISNISSTIPPNYTKQYDANNIPHHSYRQSSTFENVSPPRCYSKTINQNNPRQCIIFQNDTIHHQTNAFYDNATNNSVFMQFCFDSSLTSNPQPRSQQ